MVSFSTRPSQTALDGDGEHSPYSDALIKRIPAENVEVLEMLRQVSKDVQAPPARSKSPGSTSRWSTIFTSSRAAGALDPKRAARTIDHLPRSFASASRRCILATSLQAAPAIPNV